MGRKPPASHTQPTALCSHHSTAMHTPGPVFKSPRVSLHLDTSCETVNLFPGAVVAERHKLGDSVNVEVAQ